MQQVVIPELQQSAATGWMCCTLLVRGSAELDAWQAPTGGPPTASKGLWSGGDLAAAAAPSDRDLASASCATTPMRSGSADMLRAASAAAAATECRRSDFM